MYTADKFPGAFSAEQEASEKDGLQDAITEIEAMFPEISDEKADALVFEDTPDEKSRNTRVLTADEKRAVDVFEKEQAAVAELAEKDLATQEDIDALDVLAPAGISDKAATFTLGKKKTKQEQEAEEQAAVDALDTLKFE